MQRILWTSPSFCSDKLNYFYLLELLNSKLSPPQPVGLRNCNAAAFSPLKKFATHFFNSDFVGTGEKNAAYAITGVNSKHKSKTL